MPYRIPRLASLPLVPALLLAFAGAASAGDRALPTEPAPGGDVACVWVQAEGQWTLACGELIDPSGVGADAITERQCIRDGGTVGSPYGDGRRYCMGFLGAPSPIL